MAARKNTRPRAFILDALPAELQLKASPLRCVCRGCHPELSEAERAAESCTQTRWCTARTDWCRLNGYPLIDLILAERPREAPSKKRAATARTTNRKETR